MEKTFEAYLARLRPEMRAPLRVSTHRIFERSGLNSRGKTQDSQTQIVVGEVQSGKTSSFTALSALARDYKCPIVVVIAGTKDNLVRQTRDRLIEDLDIGTNAGYPEWELVFKPKEKNVEELLPILDNWNDSMRSMQFRTTLLLVVLKSSAGIRNAAKFLTKLQDDFSLGRHPILVVDDEADQAGLNIRVNQGLRSAVYSSLLELRKAIPWYSYCMYTATPQANLFIDIIDDLSPERVTVLEPGNEYIGGEILFSGNFRYVVPIPANELSVAANPTQLDSPPESLKSSLAYFFVALAISQKRGNPRPISMLIHASGLQNAHEIYNKWVHAIVKFWLLQIEDEREGAFNELLSMYIHPAIKEFFKSTEEVDWPYLDREIRSCKDLARDIKYLLPKVEIRIVNGASPLHTVEKNEWDRHPGWIVIGGNKLDRGFTIKELAVTYMPRANSANVDTLQQRGRFFGYKSSYRDLLRGWFSPSTEEMFSDYVVHEQEMHRQLKSLDVEDKDVRDWRRSFILPVGMEPTRQQVISILSNRFNLDHGFVFTQRMLYDKSVALGFTEMMDRISFLKSIAEVEVTDPRVDNPNHHVVCSYSEVIDFMNDWVASGEERASLSKIARWIEGIRGERDLEGHVYFVDGLNVRQRGKAFNTDLSVPQKEWKVGNLFEGRKYVGSKYPGDTAMIAKRGITLQIHRIHPRELDDTHEVLALVVGLGEEFNFYNLEQLIVS